MSVNQVSGFNPNFKGKRNEGGSFVPGFVVGTGAGLLATKAFPPAFLKSEITTADQLKGLKADEFKLSGDLTDEQKKAEKTIKDYLAKAGTEEAKATGSTATASSAASEKARAQASAERTSKELSNSFVNTTEVPVKKFLGGKTVEQFEKDVVKKHQEIVDKKTKTLEDLQTEFSTNETKMQKYQEILKEQEKIKENAAKQPTADELADAATKKNDLKTAQDELKAANDEYKKLGKSASKVEKQEALNEIAAKRRAVADALRETRPEYKNAAEKYFEDYKKLKEEAIEAEADAKAAKEAAEDAKLEADTARRKKADDATSKKEEYEKLKKEADAKETLAKSKRAEANTSRNIAREMKTLKTPEDRIKAMEKRVTETQTIEEGLNTKINKVTTEVESSMHDLGVVESKLKTAKEAADGVVKRSVFKQVLSGNLSSIKAPEAGSGATKEAETALGKAIEALKGHMPKVAPGWGKALAISAGVGVVLGLITKSMGGKKEETYA